MTTFERTIKNEAWTLKSMIQKLKHEIQQNIVKNFLGCIKKDKSMMVTKKKLISKNMLPWKSIL